MRAYRFLGPDATGTISGFAWPMPQGSLPGGWVVPPADGTTSGVVAQRVQDLPRWLETELWEVELRGNVREGSTRLLAEEARLVRRIPQWNDAAAMKFGMACVARLQARAIGILEERGWHDVASKLRTAAPTESGAALDRIDTQGTEPAALVAGYLKEACLCVTYKVFGSLAFVVHVASIDPRLGWSGGPSERQLQAEWFRSELSL